MFHKTIDNRHFLRFESGEELVSTLTDFIANHSIRSGSISAIGASNHLKIGSFDVKSKQYHEKEFTGEHEILSLNGNITKMDDKPYVHLHITVANRDFQAFGGHLTHAIINPTCEMIITSDNDTIKRFKDDKTGLNLWDL